MKVSVFLNQTQTMIFCLCNQDWVNRKGYRYLLSQRRRERRGKMNKNDTVFAKNTCHLCVLCASARKKVVNAGFRYAKANNNCQTKFEPLLL